MNVPSRTARKCEVAAAWLAAATALVAALFGTIGPHLGGSGPGLRSLFGFVVEAVAIAWVLGGLLAGIVGILAAIRKHRWPARVLFTVALVFLVPEAWGHLNSSAPDAQESGPAIRVASVNLAAWNHRDPLMREALLKIDADVFVFSEITFAWEKRLKVWFGDDYPHRAMGGLPNRPGYDKGGARLAIWSRVEPAGAPEVLRPDFSPAQVRLPVFWQGRELAIYGLHLPVAFPRWYFLRAYSGRADILDWVRKEELPMIVAGDFNATPRSAFMQRFRDLGLASASKEINGHALLTWPSNKQPLKLFWFAIDHILSSSELAALDYRTGPETKSDHLPIIAEFAWR